MDASTLAGALLQGVFLAALFSGFGTTLFLIGIAPPALRRMSSVERRVTFRTCLMLARLSLLASVLLGVSWLGFETAELAGANGLHQAIKALPVVVLQTEFGHLLVTQISLSAAAVILARREAWLLGAATCCAGIATALQAWHLHAASMSDKPLLVSEVVHIVAAAVWLGSLLPLALLVLASSPGVAALACRRYSPFGTACVVALALTAFYQGWVLIGGPQALVATAYGWAALVKLALFLALIAFACRNRFVLASALSATRPIVARRDLQRSVMGETAIGFLIVLVASVLASLPPGMDMMMQ
jgi:copper resistance protein D